MVWIHSWAPPLPWQATICTRTTEVASPPKELTSAQLSSRRTSYRFDSEKNWEAATKPWHGYAPSS